MLLYKVCKALMKIWKTPLQSMYLILIFGPWQITYLLSEVPVKIFITDNSEIAVIYVTNTITVPHDSF